MNKVLVLFIADDNYKSCKLSLENLDVHKHIKEPLADESKGEEIIKIGDYEIDFFILDLTNSLHEEYCKIFNVIQTSKEKLFSDINKLLNESNLELFCIIPSCFFPEHNFMFDLVISYFELQNSGILGILSETNNIQFSHALCYDEDFNASVIYSEHIKGLLFFSRFMLHSIGYFDTSDNAKGCEIEQYCLRSYLSGFNNYYIDNNIACFPKLIFYEYEKAWYSIEKMKQSKNFYIHFSTN